MNNKLLIGLVIVLSALLIAGVIYVMTQTQSAITKTVDVTLVINPAPDFTLEANPLIINTFPNRNVAYTASVTSVNSFAGDVVFSVGGLPAGVIIDIQPSDILTLGAGETKGVQINLSIPEDLSLVGTHVLTITAESTAYN